MIFKINKEKENSKTERATNWMVSGSPSTAATKNRQYGNTAILNVTLHSNNKLLKIRRNSNFNPKLLDTSDLDTLQTVYAKRISLCDNRERSKNKNCRSASSHYQKSILQESNFDLLKQEAKKLEEQSSFCALYRWRPSASKSTRQAEREQKDQNTGIIQSIKKSKKANMRKIIKGRPQIKKLLQQNRERILKQKTIEYTECMMTEQHELRPYLRIMDQNGYQNCQSVLNTIL